jgi:hypothetical protein
MVVLPCWAELPAHHFGADNAVDDRLVDHSPQPRPVIAAQDLLRAMQTSTRRSTSSWSSSLGPFRNVAREYSSVWSRPSTTTGSKLRMEAAEGVPPAGLAGHPGELDEPVSFGAGDAVELQEHPNVAGLGPAPAGLDAEERGG